MRCQKCRGQASVEVRRHHAAFCNEHFIEFFDRQVERAIESGRMFTRDERVLVVVSGGKDSLALWDVLGRLGYRTAGLHINLGIGEYSQESQRKAEAYAAGQGAELLIADPGIRDERGGVCPRHAPGQLLGVRPEQALPLQQSRAG